VVKKKTYWRSNLFQRILSNFHAAAHTNPISTPQDRTKGPKGTVHISYRPYQGRLFLQMSLHIFLKGLDHQMDMGFVDMYDDRLDLGPRKGHGWFFNFLGIPPILIDINQLNISLPVNT
jgi:hypothetical protein